MKKLLLVVIFVLLVGCASDASVASQNLSVAADRFELIRRVVFYNSFTDTYMLSVEGRCSIYDDGNQLEVTCKTGFKEYKKHFLGLSNNVTYFAEQLGSANVDIYRYEVIFKPESIISDVSLETSGQ